MKPVAKLDVWVVDDDQSVRWVLEKALRQEGWRCRSFERAEHLLEAIERTAPDVLLTDVRMPGLDGITLMERLTHTHRHLPVIVMTAHSDLDSAVSAYRGGAFEYLPKPFDLDEVVELVRRAAGQKPPVETAPSETSSNDQPLLLGSAPAMQEVFRAIGRLSGTSMTVLITGESGTGKELVARALHQHSPRAEQPFVALNTSAIAANLLESELFGHERGSFTGADTRRIGRFEQANGGTFFLDEIGDMSPALQTRLLRVLAESEFFRVGGGETISVDVRIIAATNQDLALAVKEGRFREDLLHRLNVVRIHMPPLRQRRQDIPLLLNHYLSSAATELKTPPKTINSDALELLQTYDWPGNVRQLVNATRRLTLTAPGGTITAPDISADLGKPAAESSTIAAWTEALGYWAERETRGDAAIPLLELAVPALETVLIQVALKKAGGHRQEAAKILGWGRNTLARKIRELGLDNAGTTGQVSD